MSDDSREPGLNETDDLLDQRWRRNEGSDALLELLGPDGPCEICGEPGVAMIVPVSGFTARLGVDSLDRVVICMSCDARRMESRGGAEWVRAQAASAGRKGDLA